MPKYNHGHPKNPCRPQENDICSVFPSAAPTNTENCGCAPSSHFESCDHNPPEECPCHCGIPCNTMNIPGNTCPTPKTECGCVEPSSGCPCGKDCSFYMLPNSCDNPSCCYVKCCDQNGCCGLYNAACRNRFWPEFAHPRWLCCKDLYCGS